MRIWFTLVFLATFIGLCWLWPHHGPLCVLPTHSWPLWDDSLSEYIHVSSIKSHTVLTTAKIWRGLFLYWCFHWLCSPGTMPKRNDLSLIPPGPSLLLASFKTCLLIALRHQGRHSFIHHFPALLCGVGVHVVKPMAMWNTLHASQYQ